MAQTSKVRKIQQEHMLTHGAITLYAQLLRHANDGGVVFTTERKAMSLTRTRSFKMVLSAFRDLESSGLISLEVRRGRNGYTKITLLHPAARAVAGESEPPGGRASISPAEAAGILPGMQERREWQDVVRYRSGVRTYEEAEARFPEFLALMKTRGKTWARESDLIEHYANWLAKRLMASRPRAAKRRDETLSATPTATLERAYELITNQKLR